MMQRLLRIAALWLALCAPALASQSTLVTPSAPLPMTGLASFLNNAFLSIGSCNSGNSAPANGTGGAAVSEECWANLTSAPTSIPFAFYDGAQWVTFGTLNATAHTWSLPAPSSSTLGGVESLTCASHQWLNTISTAGVPACGQPGFSDLSGAPTPLPQGRLTLVTGTPVMTANETGKSTIYYDSYKGGGLVPVYNGSNDIVLPIGSGEISDVLQSSGSGAVTASNVFDEWAVNVSGTLTLCHANGAGSGSSGTGWAGDTGGSNTARGTGYSKLDLKTRPYITNANAITHCWNGTTDEGSISANQATYLGSFYTTANGQTGMAFTSSGAGGGGGVLGLFNAYNQEPVASYEYDTTSSWSIQTTTWRHADANANNAISFVDGLGYTAVSSIYTIAVQETGATNGYGFGLAENWSSGGPSIQSAIYQANTNASTSSQVFGSFRPSIGFNTISALEVTVNAASSITVYAAGYGGSIGQVQALSIQLKM